MRNGAAEECPVSIAENLEKIEGRIERAAIRAGRDPRAVSLLAVTKTVDPVRIEEAIDAGVRFLGENRVQEAKEKIAVVGRKAAWHLIGHLQRNKVRRAVSLFDMVHSVDSIRIAQALDQEAKKQGKRLPVLIQVNVGADERKFGIDTERAVMLVRQVATMEYLSVEGLMTIPPYFEDPEGTRPLYRRLRGIGAAVTSLQIPGAVMTHLSMGMSHDYEVAVEEGATWVRIGSAIFGGRD